MSDRHPLIVATDLVRDYKLPRTRLTGPVPIRHALRGVSLEVGEGDSVAIIGESGSGKSTLVRILLGLGTPTSGSVLFDGRPVVNNRRDQMMWLRRQSGIVFQDPYASLDPRMTAAQIIAEPLAAQDTPGNHRERVLEVLDQVGLTADSAERYPNEFSGGQRQRIALARAIAHKPRLLIGDEPVSALDVTVRAQILDLLRDLRAELSLTLVIVSHDIGMVQGMSDTVHVMTDGAIVESGPVKSILSTPQHPYTQRLLSSVPTLE
ncbi:ATP-binding cassette domain-containing protein [Lysinibacter cavernae]|uniref:Peptide/nickel transport system ATP-binding protein n=1 Tax=Lysinibacter cavernae TaxID=1640652 RepID=A0A7X5R3G5_9MICO|nr:ATP-binding cassette domain-containing protein [Lysinibacter cavernae]NIH54963.1 peptide/nickel transport system ATP-binding protein [Lysinibacter cavernae]